MIARVSRARRGITLVEILISILIMGVGLISLATLFPLGLIRLREATRSSRAGLTFQMAADEMDTRALLYKPSFTQTWYWTLGNGGIKVPRDPFVYDAINGSTTNAIASNPAVRQGQFLNPNNPLLPGPPLLQAGLPFCYDPLWRSLTGVVPNTGLADSTLDFAANYVNKAADARFGDGLLGGAQPGLRNDPDGTAPAAFGLQRLTNFIPWSSAGQTPLYPFTSQNLQLVTPPGLPPQQPIDVSGIVFASNDDLVFNTFNGGAGPNSLSPLIPDMSAGGGPQADYRFTWFITGRQLDAGGNGLQFVGEVVVCDGRPFGYDPIPGQASSAPSGETVVEAIFGYGTTFVTPKATTSFATADRTVLLRWPVTLADPQVRAGGWICDVTYEANINTFRTRAMNTGTTFARCYWYQVGKRTDPQVDPVLGPRYRSMVVTITSPVRDKTLLSTKDATPVHLNAALIMPSVINVFPRAIEVFPIPVP